MSEHKVLLVEDDTSLLEVIKYNLNKDGYHVLTAEDGETAVEKALKEEPDLIILDIMLPKMDGLEVCRTLRKDTNAPIIMLTAKAEEIDKVVGLEMGADDYMTKPFGMRELLSRVKAALRRSGMAKKAPKDNETETKNIISAGSISVDTARHKVFFEGNEVNLSPREFKLIVFLMKNSGQVFSRDYIIEKVWGYDYPGDIQTIDVHIRWLRKKLEKNPSEPKHLITVRGVGYKFEGQ